MDTKFDMDDEAPDFDSGEWVMMGFDRTAPEPVLVLSPFWEQITSKRKAYLLRQWIELLQRELIDVISAKKPPPV